ncbi:MAG: type II toxin-antitoxin system VapC family toxin, partial [Nitrospirae bacterium]|nr:type II toxin-antitoxin system VapC family toxin [Nitrospirota bacterium]
KLLDKLYNTFHSLGRLIAPDVQDWQQAGKIIAKMGRKYGFEKRFLSRITNDVLIAITARKVGAVVITKNKKDFLLIKEFLNFKMSE